jgi:hypothetical protein
MVKYIFEGDDLKRIRDTHGGFLPPIGIIMGFIDRHKGKVRFSESRSGGDDYWVKVKIEDPEIQSQFESCVLRRSFDWITRSRRLEKSRKIKIQKHLERFPYKVTTNSPKNYDLNNRRRAEQWYHWCTRKFGRRNINGRWYQHDNGVTYFMRDQDALLYQLHQPF